MQLRLHTLLTTQGIVGFLLVTGLASTAFGQLLFVPDTGTNAVSEFATNPTGVLSPLCTPSIATAPNTQPVGLTGTPNGSYLYAANRSGAVVAYAANPGPSCVGQLSVIGSYALGNIPYGITTDSSGKYLFVSQASGSVTAFIINSNGSLISNGTTAVSGNPAGITTVSVGGNSFVYVTLAGLGANNLVGYQIQTNGTLGSVVATGTVPSGSWDSNAPGPVQSSPQNIIANGNLLYVTDDNADGTPGHGLTVFSVASNGALTLAGNYTTGSAPQGLATDGTYLYVTNQFDPSVWAYTLSGGLPGSHVTQPNVGWDPTNQPWGVTIDPATKSVYVSDLAANGIWGFTQGLAAAIPGVTPSGAGNTGANSQPGQFVMAHILPLLPPPPSTSVPAASSISLAALAILLAGCGALVYRKSARTSSVQ